MELETFRWLLTDEGQALLAAATAAEGTPLQVQRSLRETSPGSTEEKAERVAAALGQVELGNGPRRSSATTRRGCTSPATDSSRPPGRPSRGTAHPASPWSARPSSTSPAASVATWSAFARAGLTTAGIDLDPLRVEMARANLAALGLGGAVQVGDATSLDVTPFATAYADPARRSARGRSFRADDWTPPWSFAESLLTGRACIKVAPGIPHSLVPDRAEAEWVSDAGEVKEAVIWSPTLATVARRATVIGRGGLATLTDEDDPGAGVGGVGRFLYEPDGAVIRAGLVTAVAAGVEGHLVDRKIAYVSSDAAFHTPFARSYRVVEELPYREKQLRAALRERNVGTLTIKKRGVDIAPEQLRQRLALRGHEVATLVLTRVAGEGTALLVEPL